MRSQELLAQSFSRLADVHESTSHVTLRRLKLEDADEIGAWAADHEFSRHADWSAGLSFAEHRRFHQRLIESPPAELMRLGAIHEGILVGYVDLHGSQAQRRELGFVIGGRDRWGQGLGHMAAAAGLDYGFGHLGLEEIWAEVLEANQRSVRILQRLGLVETRRGDDGVFLDPRTYYRRFAMTAPEWARRRTYCHRHDIG